MTAFGGSEVVLRIGDGGLPVESFTPLGGVRRTVLTLGGRPAAPSGVLSGGWKQGLSGAGERSVRLRAEGVFTDSATEQTIRQLAATLASRTCEIAFGSGEVWSGPFQVAAFERVADRDAPVTFAVVLESAGTMSVA